MYILEMSLLKKGDIILTAERAWLSKGVRLSTLGRFSHAILYVGGGSYIHSDGNGVHAANIQRLQFKSKKHVAVFRPNKPNFVEGACIYARAQIGKEYSVKEAIRTKRNPLTAREVNRQFCSRLVAQAYASVNYEISTNVDYCTPKDIHKSQKLHEIKKCIKKASSKEVEFTLAYNPLEDQDRITNEILSYSRTITNSDIQTFDQLSEYLLMHPKFDNDITRFIEKTGYFDMWRYEYSKNKWRYDYKELVAAPFSEEQKIHQCHMEIKNAQPRKALYSFNLQQVENVIKYRKLEYFKLHVELYRNLVRLADENILACSMYLNSKT